MPTLRGNGKVEIDEAEIQAFPHRVICSRRVAKSNWPIAPFEGAFAAGVGGKGREHPFQAEGIECFVRGSKDREIV
jgi:hypothetical protein